MSNSLNLYNRARIFNVHRTHTVKVDVLPPTVSNPNRVRSIYANTLLIAKTLLLFAL